jgi:hypothetical protein
MDTRQVTQTPRSSYTLNDNRSAVVLPTSTVSLERELAHDEEVIHRYGGDDPHDPPPKSPRNPAALGNWTPLDPEEIDWDGPDDEENPQNWTDSRKWLITFTCVVMTVNVYVLFIDSSKHG